MRSNYVLRLKIRLWNNRLPLFMRYSVSDGDPYNYYAIYFLNIHRVRYNLVSYSGKEVTLLQWDPALHAWSKTVTMTTSDLVEMQEEIIHFRRHGPLRFDSIIVLSVNYYTRIAYVKNFISRIKGQFSSALFAKKELKSRDRIALLNLLVNHYVNQPPSQVIAGVSEREVADLLYGKLWYKHIRNEEFRRKIRLILQSLVITEDLSFKDERYFVCGKALATIVSHDKEEKRDSQQIKMQKNMVRLMIIIAFSTLMITLAILAQAGIVDLHRLWQYILNIKPLRFLLKLI